MGKQRSPATSQQAAKPLHSHSIAVIFRWALVLYLVAEYGSIVPAPGHGPVWGPIKAVLGGIVLVTALLLAAPGLGRHIPLILITAGLAINLTGPDPLATIPSALHELSNVAALLALMPMIRTVFEGRPYGQALLMLGPVLQKKPVVFQLAISVFTHVISSVASVSSLFISSTVLGQMTGNNPRRLHRGGVAILRGYTAGFLWAPSAVPLIVSMHYTGATLAATLPVGLALAVLLVGFQTAFEWLVERKSGVQGAGLSGDGAMVPVELQVEKPHRLVMEFLILLAVFLGSVLLLESVTGIDLVHVVPLVAVGMALGYKRIHGSTAELRNMVKDFAAKELLARHGEMALIQSAGFLAGSIRLTGLGERVIAALLQLLPGGDASLVPLLAILIPLIAISGIPPVGATLLVVASLEPSLLAAAPVQSTLSIMLGTSAAALLAPFSLPAIALSQATGFPIWSISLRANWFYVIGVIFTGRLGLWVLSRYLGVS